MSSEGRCALFCATKENTLQLNMSHSAHCTYDVQVEIAVKAALVLLAVSVAKSLLGVSRCYEQYYKHFVCCLMAVAQVKNHCLKPRLDYCRLLSRWEQWSLVSMLPLRFGQSQLLMVSVDHQQQHHTG